MNRRNFIKNLFLCGVGLKLGVKYDSDQVLLIKSKEETFEEFVSKLITGEYRLPELKKLDPKYFTKEGWNKKIMYEVMRDE